MVKVLVEFGVTRKTKVGFYVCVISVKYWEGMDCDELLLLVCDEKMLMTTTAICLVETRTLPNKKELIWSQ